MMKITDYQTYSPSAINGNEARYREDPKKLMEACQQFEAIFINMMLKQMRSTVAEGGLTEKSQAREIFESMKDEKLAEEMSKSKGFGLAQFLYKQMQRQLVTKE